MYDKARYDKLMGWVGVLSMGTRGGNAMFAQRAKCAGRSVYVVIVGGRHPRIAAEGGYSVGLAPKPQPKIKNFSASKEAFFMYVSGVYVGIFVRTGYIQ